MARRNAILGLAALIAVTGCNAGTPGGLRRAEPPVAKETLSKTRIIAQINKNASTIHSLMATPSMLVAGDGQAVRLDGRMAMERPRDFHLEIKFHGRPQADIGSNDQGFWFWVKDDKSKALYFCDYEHANSNPLGVSMQPDWIMEAMGLREIPEREAATISVSKGDLPGHLVLTQLRNDPKGGTLTKLTVVNESTGEILEHRLYSGAKEKLLAQAIVSQTQKITMEPTKADPAGSLVYFPAKIQLEWFVEKFKLDITMGEPTINPTFDAKERLLVFSEPKIRGAIRTDLAKIGNPNGKSPSSSYIYESAPRSGRIRLENPEAETPDLEGPSRLPSGSTSNSSSRTVPLTADLATLPPVASGYIGPQVPRGIDPEAIQAISGPGLGRGTFR